MARRRRNREREQGQQLLVLDQEKSIDFLVSWNAHVR